MNLLQRVTRAIPARGLFALALVAAALCSTTVARSATKMSLGGAPVVIDGNITDLIQYGQSLQQSGQGCGINIVDNPTNGVPTPEITYNDPKFIPCPLPVPALGTHWVNGIEIFRHYMDYAHGSTTLFLGLTTEGFVGDSDGNDNPDTFGGGACNPNDNVEDTFGISGNELYQWVFDLNCDGNSDASIKIVDNAVVGTGGFAGITGTFAFRQDAISGATGHDLEVQVNLLAPLPAAFKYLRVEANAFDGLSEDRSDGQICAATPHIAVLKSAEPITVCPNGKTRFTVTVSNDGLTPLSVVVVDTLPSALSYASNLSSTCGVGPPQVNGNVVTFPAFNLAAGANCSISFDAQASPECFGQVTNHVDVTGTFASPCLGVGNDEVVTAQADANVTCKAPPCVELTLDCPAQVCTDKQYDVTATAKNCSLEPEDITINIDGTPFTITGVAGGAIVSRKITVTMPACTGEPVPHTATATATNSCATTPAVTKNCSTACAPNPCVQFTFECPGSACAGTPIDLKGTATNCSTGPENIKITIDGTDYQFNNVAAGGSVSQTKTLNMPQCTPGTPVNFNASAVATNDCGTTDPVNKNCAVQCLAGPCVNLTPDASDPACKGAKFLLTGKATNCGDGVEDIVIKYGDVVVKSCNAVPAGGNCAYSFEVTMPACNAGSNVPFVVTAIATAACGSTTDEATHNVPCQAPQIHVVKSAQETTVANLGTIHYTITVSNPSATVGLENIVVTDHLCAYAKYANNANVEPFSAPALGTTGDVIWHIDALAPGASVVFTFQVTVDVAYGGGACPTTVSCPNVVDVIGYCQGSNGESSVTDEAEVATPITCAGEACPRTPGFWNAQCAQKGNGSTKFTKAQVTAIAECIDDASAFFNWPAGTDFDRFCRNISPPTPMDQRKQAKRQFAAMLANVCTDALNLQPSQGGTIFLDPSTPVHCDGLNATTIGELIDEVDALLIDLEGKSLNDPDVKNQYGAIISCIDGINNGRTIATRADCEETGGTAPTSGDDEIGAAGASASVELYRPMPNPFSTTTAFSYMVSGPDAAGVEITVYDVAGRQIRRLVSGEQTAGVHAATWDGKNDQGAQVQRGVYFVRTVIAGRKEATNRILYLTNGQ